LQKKYHHKDVDGSCNLATIVCAGAEELDKICFDCNFRACSRCIFYNSVPDEQKEEAIAAVKEILEKRKREIEYHEKYKNEDWYKKVAKIKSMPEKFKKVPQKNKSKGSLKGFVVWKTYKYQKMRGWTVIENKTFDSSWESLED